MRLTIRRKILFLISPFFLLSVFSLNAQEKFSTDPRHKTVRLILNDGFNLKAFRDSVLLSSVPQALRPELVIRRIQAARKASQNAFQNELNQFEQRNSGSYGKLEFYTLVNLVVLETNDELLEHLVQSGLVKEVLDERIRPVYQAPFERRLDVSREIGGSEPGLKAIGAPFLWKLGYTGADRIVYIIDTGVWPNHPAIKRQWSGNYFPGAWTWKSYDRVEPGDKSESHGTHVTGTVLGLDTLNKDTIGLAFNARYIAADPIAESILGIKPIETLIGAFEFALNPDGDTATSDDVPDVITNSWGIPFYDEYICQADLIKDMLLAMDAAGIAVEFSAGNEGPNPETISLPQFVSIDTLSIFTVGAVDAGQNTFPIANFSSRGPTRCISSDSIPSLRIKPEVVAPGYAVRSSIGQEQYAYYSGTSMAGPHVSGGVALLKEAFPMLSGRDILNALYQTAYDLGEEGEDNVYGRGLIQLEAAYRFLEERYTPVPPNTSAYDLAIDNIVIPTTSCVGNIDLKVILQNRGALPIPVRKLIVRNNLTKMTRTLELTQTLGPGERDTIEVQGMVLDTIQHEFYATVYSDSTIAERNRTNNHCTRRMFVTVSRPLPYSETFEYNKVNAQDRLVLNPDHLVSWDTVRTGGLPSGNYSAHMRFIGYAPRSGQIDEIRLPRFEIPVQAKKLSLRLDYAYRYRNGYKDSLLIDVSTDCGESWPIHLFAQGGNSLATVDTNWSQFVPFNASHWDSLHFTLDSLISKGAITIRLAAVNRGGSRLYLDNIQVYTDLPAGNKKIDLTEWSLYPNPAENTLHLQTDRPLKNAKVLVCDLQGRILLKTAMQAGTTNLEIPLTGMRTGLYLLRLDSEEGCSTRKFMRQDFR